jgi:hypothetical protein
MTEEPSGSGWPDDSADAELEFTGPGAYMLMVLYSLPFLILLLFPSLAWLVLLPFAAAMRWNTRPPHRRRLVWINLGAGLISLAPWIVMIVS